MSEPLWKQQTEAKLTLGQNWAETPIQTDNVEYLTPEEQYGGEVGVHFDLDVPRYQVSVLGTVIYDDKEGIADTLMLTLGQDCWWEVEHHEGFKYGFPERFSCIEQARETFWEYVQDGLDRQDPDSE